MRSTTINPQQARKQALKIYQESIVNGENYDEDVIQIVNIMGGIDCIINDYLSPNNERLSVDQIVKLNTLFSTPAVYRHKSDATQGRSRVLTAIQHNKQPAENYKMLVYDVENEKYELNANETYIAYLLRHYAQTCHKNSFHTRFWFTFLIFISLFIFYPVLSIFKKDFVFPVYIISISVVIWIPYNIIFILSVNMKGFKYLIVNSFTFWMRIMYLLYGYIAALWYYFRLKPYYLPKYLVLQQTANILLGFCLFLLLCVVTMLDIIYIPKSTKLFLNVVVSIIATYVTLSLQFFTIDSDDDECLDTSFIAVYGKGFSLNTVMVTASNVLTVVLWKQCFLFMKQANADSVEKGVKSVIVKRYPFISWSDKKIWKISSKSAAERREYEDEDHSDEDIKVATTIHRELAVDKTEEIDPLDVHLCEGMAAKDNEYSVSDNIEIPQADDVVAYGDKVEINAGGYSIIGVVKFIGNLEKKEDVYYGIEVEDEKYGESNGSIDNVKYFNTKNNGETGVFCKEKDLNMTKIEQNNDASVVRVCVGDKINMTRFDCQGTVKFIGDVEGKEGLWYGVELDQANGLNNGVVNRRAYFSCEPKHGVFLKGKHITTIHRRILK